MIARFRVLLPIAIHLKQGDNFAPQLLTSEGEEFTIYAPYLSSTKPPTEHAALSIPLREIAEQLAPTSALSDPSVQIDGQPALKVDALQIDMRRADFNRVEDTNRNPVDDDPPATQFFDVANSFLVRLRSALQASVIKPLSLDRCPWTIEYLKDNGEPLPKEDGKFRRRSAFVGKIQVIALSEAIWNDVSRMPTTFTPPVWETLLLDAPLQLPEIGPAMVLTAAALENLVSECLDWLAGKANLLEGLWSWLNDRGDYRKHPSTTEQFEILLKIFTTKSLKDEPDLWNAFSNIRNARNNFVHEGRAAIGKASSPLTSSEALGLIVKANRIVAWMEQFLPLEKRRQKSEAQILTQVSRQL